MNLIKSNYAIYTGEVPLSLTEKICGLRTVCDEVCVTILVSLMFVHRYILILQE